MPTDCLTIISLPAAGNQRIGRCPRGVPQPNCRPNETHEKADQQAVEGNEINVRRK